MFCLMTPKYHLIAPSISQRPSKPNGPPDKNHSAFLYRTGLIKRVSPGSMLQDHLMNSGTFESETHTNKKTSLIINKIYESVYILLGEIPIKAILSNINT